MELAAPLRRDGALDRKPCELVAERDGVSAGLEHAGGDAFVEMTRMPRERSLEQPELGPRRYECGTLEKASGRHRKPGRTGEDSVANRRRQAVASGAEELRDEERVTAGEREDRGTVSRMRCGEPADGLGCQRRHLETVDRRSGGEVSEQDAKWMVVGDLVAEGDDDERRRLGDPAADDPKDIERGLVGPVRILDHEHDRASQLLEQCHRDVAWMAPRLDGRRERSPDLRRYVGEGAERSGRREMLARTGERAATMLRGETTYERGLADAGFAADEDEPAAGFARSGEAVEKRLPFDQKGRRARGHAVAHHGACHRARVYAAALQPVCARRSGDLERPGDCAAGGDRARVADRDVRPRLQRLRRSAVDRAVRRRAAALLEQLGAVDPDRRLDEGRARAELDRHLRRVGRWSRPAAARGSSASPGRSGRGSSGRRRAGRHRPSPCSPTWTRRRPRCCPGRACGRPRRATPMSRGARAWPRPGREPVSPSRSSWTSIRHSRQAPPQPRGTRRASRKPGYFCAASRRLRTVLIAGACGSCGARRR